ncbi:hypothetical protein [Microcystis aeruginosa]|uniref:hypothetical protein n=1 Tax=Microcystis aeruginosa TaxID=1126 RepID=UPI0002F77004|nr:hypothetical protein [Microcystis aeruginosa]
MIDRSLCPLCLCGSFHPLALEKCILEYILPTKAGKAKNLGYQPQVNFDIGASNGS